LDYIPLVDWFYGIDDEKKVYCTEHHEHQDRNIHYSENCIECQNKKGRIYKGIFILTKKSPVRIFQNKKGNLFYVSKRGTKVYSKYLKQPQNGN
jgi:hypothetical protein